MSIPVSQTRVFEFGTRAECKNCREHWTFGGGIRSVTDLRTAAMRHVRQTGHRVRRYVEDITEYAPEEHDGE